MASTALKHRVAGECVVPVPGCDHAIAGEAVKVTAVVRLRVQRLSTQTHHLLRGPIEISVIDLPENTFLVSERTPVLGAGVAVVAHR